MKILVTGGAGYIGSTVCSALLDTGHIPIILDSLATGNEEFVKGRIFYHGDIADHKILAKIHTDHPDIACCMHFAARIIVSESVLSPNLYYKENFVKSIALFDSLHKLGIKRIIFSSSASVYDTVSNLEVTEDSPVKPLSPYAKTKLATEMALDDFCNVGYFRGLALRYFNPIGADKQLRTGSFIPEPTHILGRLLAIAKETKQGRDLAFEIFGTDWQTRDGTAMRDYIHIWDLALAHVAAAERFDSAVEDAHYQVINLGSGKGVTVKEFVDAFKKIYGKPLPVVDAPRREGDALGAFANCEKAKKLLGWVATQGIEEGISDALLWHTAYTVGAKK